MAARGSNAHCIGSPEPTLTRNAVESLCHQDHGQERGAKHAKLGASDVERGVRRRPSDVPSVCAAGLRTSPRVAT
jgi:hypothetical protein